LMDLKEKGKKRELWGYVDFKVGRNEHLLYDIYFTY
jgi:hypothetical protein